MNDFSFLIGGKAGYGIDKSSLIIATIINQLGYRLYVYHDYPSLIRGGHTFSIIRASRTKIGAHRNAIDFLLALNQDTISLHKDKVKSNTVIIYDSDSIKSEGIGVPLTKIIKEENAPEIMRNTCIIGALCKVLGLSWDIVANVFQKKLSKEVDLNLKVARRGYDMVKELVKIEALGKNKLPLLTGNEAVAFGLIRGGIKAYISYPMTPSSSILHFLAHIAEDFSLKVIHPENEIAVMLMALGFSYCGQKVAVGTSGGGFCLMTEGLSFSGMAELPIVIILGQRPGPSTGLPTHSSQTELLFALHAGQGEFSRLIISPGDPEEAYYWAQIALNLSWKYQMPSILLTDKTLGEGTYSFDIDSIEDVHEEGPALWDRKSLFKRYLHTKNGVSPLAFVPDKDAVIKVNSYEHDETGITTEDTIETIKMQDKRLRKEKYLIEELTRYETVKTYGNNDSKTGLLCWGSNKGVCIEAAERLGLKVVQPLVFSPFPLEQFKKALKGLEKLIAVESNATAQLVQCINHYGLDVDEKILKYSGRPFSLEELEKEVGEVTR